MRLLIAMMKHETNTFSPVPTPLARFGHGPGPLYGEAAVTALRVWPRDGTPDDPRAWLMEQLWLIEQLPLLFDTRSEDWRHSELCNLERAKGAEPATAHAAGRIDCDIADLQRSAPDEP